MSFSISFFGLELYNKAEKNCKWFSFEIEIEFNAMKMFIKYLGSNSSSFLLNLREENRFSTWETKNITYGSKDKGLKK